MATTTATTAAQVLSQLISAGADDIIEVTPGIKSALSYTTALTKLGVTIRAQDPSDRPVFQGGGSVLNFKQLRGVTFDGLVFRGTGTETLGGAPYPTGVGCKLESVTDITLRNCTFTDFMDLFQILGPSNSQSTKNLRFEYSRFTRMGRDGLQIYRPMKGFYMGYCVGDEPRIYIPRQLEEGYHPDFVQGATLSGATVPPEDYLLESNYFEGGPKTGKGTYMQNEKARGDYDPKVGGSKQYDLWHDQVGYRNLKIKNNFTRGGRTHGLVVSSCNGDCEVSGNVIREHTPGANELPKLGITGRNEGLTVTNNVIAGGLNYYDPNGSSALGSGNTISGNVTSNTAFPAGWVPLVPASFESGGNCGPYGGGPSGVTLPAQPTEKYEVGGVILKDGGFDATYLHHPSGAYGRVLKIPDATPAAVEAPAYAAGADPECFQWNSDTDATWRPFELANPPVSADGARRFRAVPGSGTYGLVGAGVTFSGRRWRYRLSATSSRWSLASAFADSFVGAAPATAAIDALEAGGWSIFDVVPYGPVFTAQIKITGETITGAQWTIEDEDPPLWRDTVQTGTDGGFPVLQLLPSATGGTEHTVEYEGTLSILVRYSADELWGPESEDAKSFTGPNAPEIPDTDWTAGNFLPLSDVPLRVAGAALVVGGAEVPGPIIVEEGDPIVVLEDETITVTLPSSPPVGAVDQVVIYAGSRHLAPRESPIVSFPVVEGEDWVYACGVTAEGAGGILAYWPVV